LYEAEVSAIYESCKDHEWMRKGKDIESIPPETEGNPTRATPCFIEILDQGEVKIYESSDVFVKMDLKGKELKGHFIIWRDDPDLNLWKWQRERVSP